MRAADESRAALAAAGTGIQVGAAMVATRFVVDQAGAIELALLRYVIGFLFLLVALALARPRWRIAAPDLLPIALLGIGQFAILVVLLNFGLQSTTAARGAVLFATMPLLTMAIAALLGREALTANKTAGVGLTVIGVALAFGDKLMTGGADREWIGALAVLASALSGALCSVLYRPYLRRYPTLPVSAFAMLASVAVLAIAAGADGFFAHAPRFTPGGWGAILFIGASSGVGYVLWLWALTHASPTRVTVFLSLSPITASALGVLVLGERPTLSLVAAMLAVIAGLWLAHRESR